MKNTGLAWRGGDSSRMAVPRRDRDLRPGIDLRQGESRIRRKGGLSDTPER